MDTDTATLNLISRASEDDKTKFYPVLNYGSDPVGKKTMIKTKAPQGKHSQETAETKVFLTYKTSDFDSVVATVGTDTGTSKEKDGITTITFDLSDPVGTLAEDFGFTVVLTLAADSTGETDGDWVYNRSKDEWSLDPFVRIKRSSYSVRAG